MIFLFFNYRASCVSYIMTGTFERNRFRGKFIYADQRSRTFLPISAQLNAILIVPISFTRAAVPGLHLKFASRYRSEVHRYFVVYP